MNYGFKTIDKINELLKSGVDKISVISRHSARNYAPERPWLEPFMGLTEDGKVYAKDFAKRLDFDGTVSFFSSMICRCLETSFMMEKGLSNCVVNSNILEESLFPFYVKNPKEVYDVVINHSEDEFFRRWFNNELSEDTICNARDSANKMLGFMKEKLSSKNINFMISHDWNLYLIQEYILNLKYKEQKRVEFLDSFILYEKDDQLFIKNDEDFVKEL
ncbi:MAG: hypothetical protein GY714_21830 [Desulfobacterales bacterium]|nr:hypothetical protein [Desulfobacterales bacterium]MCP4161759.1 hypothetical protein [Deltaproteobacteria bacterium]